MINVTGNGVESHVTRMALLVDFSAKYTLMELNNGNSIGY